MNIQLGGYEMRVKASQLVPGCILLNDVKGKTNRPIMHKNTVLTSEHIVVLERFLVTEVDVSTKLEAGELFQPQNNQTQPTQEAQPDISLTKQDSMPFNAHYHLVVNDYQSLFSQWQSGITVDIKKVRMLIIPLLERVHEIGTAVFTLHHEATKEAYFYHHSVAIGMLSAYIGMKMDLPKQEWIQIGLAAFLSDAGMAKIDHSIITKQQTLTAADMEQVKLHPTYSYRMVKSIPAVTKAIKTTILQHHEREDGSGYPLGLKGDTIHLYAKIIAVCDTYHAMTCERNYREKQSPFKVIEELQVEQFTRFDPAIVHTFIQCLTHFSIGMRVRLSDGQTGAIVFIDKQSPTRPIIRLDQNEELLKLTDHPSLYISEISES